MQFKELEKLLKNEGIEAKPKIIEYFLKLPMSTNFPKYLDGFEFWLAKSDNQSFVPTEMQFCGSHRNDFEKILIRRDFESSAKRMTNLLRRKDFYLSRIHVYCISKEDLEILYQEFEIANAWDRRLTTDREKISPATPAQLHEAKIIKLLIKRFSDPNDPTLAERRNELIRLFSTYPIEYAGAFLSRLDNKKDQLHVLFSTLSSSTQQILRSILIMNTETFQQKKTADKLRQDADKAKRDASKAAIIDKNPLKKPLYLDNIFEEVIFQFFNGAFRFEWAEKGQKLFIIIANTDIDQIGKESFRPIWTIHKSKKDALKESSEFADTGIKWYSFYLDQYGVIVPTVLNKDSMPNFFAILPNLRKEVIETAKRANVILQSFANYLNRIPFTAVDEHGNMTFNFDPLTLLQLFKIRSMNLANRPKVPKIPKIPRWDRQKIAAAIANGKEASQWSQAEKNALAAYWVELKRTNSPQEAGKAFHDKMNAAPYGADVDRLGFQTEIKTSLSKDLDYLVQVANEAHDQSLSYAVRFTAEDGTGLIKGRLVIVYLLRERPPIRIVLY